MLGLALLRLHSEVLAPIVVTVAESGELLRFHALCLTLILITAVRGDVIVISPLVCFEKLAG